MSKFETFCKKYNDEIIAVGAGIGLGLAVIVGLQARELSRINKVWLKNDIVFDKLVLENKILNSIVSKVFKVL